jgi:U3 small nucleolar RNA-associated protein 25
MSEEQSATTQLLTLLNVSAVKSLKRKRDTDDFVPSVKLNRRKTVEVQAEQPVRDDEAPKPAEEVVEDNVAENGDDDDLITEGASVLQRIFEMC